MGSDNDREHFEDYRAQTQVKHEILEDYLKPYFQILGTANTDLIYLDGFAGRGTYQKAQTKEVVDGSPLRALKLIAGNEAYSKKVEAIFLEQDAILHGQLEQVVTNFASANPHIRKPVTTCCTFSVGVGKLLAAVKGNLAPTFLFVDPCGVSGTSFEAIKNVMACKSSEAFIFFNIDGVRRIAGQDKLSDVLIELLSSKQRAEALFVGLRNTAEAWKREEMILTSYRQALREDMRVGFTIPFRVESEEQKKTSHYLIHATNHRLGFKIMKEVMWSRGRSETGTGDLQFVQASKTNYIPLFDRNYVVKDDILQALATGPKPVQMFYDDWVFRPDDLLCEPVYKQALLELEESGDIEVLDKDGRTPKRANSRQKRNGKPTLGKGYHVRLAKK